MYLKNQTLRDAKPSCAFFSVFDIFRDKKKGKKIILDHLKELFCQQKKTSISAPLELASFRGGNFA